MQPPSDDGPALRPDWDAVRGSSNGGAASEMSVRANLQLQRDALAAAEHRVRGVGRALIVLGTLVTAVGSLLGPLVPGWSYGALAIAGGAGLVLAMAGFGIQALRPWARTLGSLSLAAWASLRFHQLSLDDPSVPAIILLAMFAVLRWALWTEDASKVFSQEHRDHVVPNTQLRARGTTLKWLAIMLLAGGMLYFATAVYIVLPR